MICRVDELRDKDVINLKDGTRIGCVDDIEIDTCSAEVKSLVIYGRKRCFGLLGKDEDIVIPWQKIEVIGEDTILVCLEDCVPCSCGKRKNNIFQRLFG